MSRQSLETRVAGQSGAMPSTRSGDWTHHTADVKGSRYMANGKRYIIVAVSGGAYSGEYIAFGLPDSELRPMQGQ